MQHVLMWKQYDSLELVPSAQLSTHLSDNDSSSMWLMSLLTTWTNISPIAALKVQLSQPSPLCFLIQHGVSATPNKLQYKTRGCWPNESRANSTLTDKTEPESPALHSAALTPFLCGDKERLWMMEREKRAACPFPCFFFFFFFGKKNLGERFIQDVTAACVLVGAFRRVTAL